MRAATSVGAAQSQTCLSRNKRISFLLCFSSLSLSLYLYTHSNQHTPTHRHIHRYKHTPSHTPTHIHTEARTATHTETHTHTHIQLFNQTASVTRRSVLLDWQSLDQQPKLHGRVIRYVPLFLGFPRFSKVFQGFLKCSVKSATTTNRQHLSAPSPHPSYCL
jgi:hypothetical protein